MTLTYAILITSAPSDPCSMTAYHFAQALLDKGHQLSMIFFFNDGVHHANAFTTTPQDEPSPVQQWHKLHEERGVALKACISSALRRGICDPAEQARYELPGNNLDTAFEIAGLGQWVEACIEADRVIRFGAIS